MEKLINLSHAGSSLPSTPPAITGAGNVILLSSNTDEPASITEMISLICSNHHHRDHHENVKLFTPDFKLPKSLGADYGQLSKKSNICEETQGFRKLLRSKIGSLFSNQSFKFCLHFTNFSHVQNTLRLGIFLLGLFLLWFVFPDLVWFLFQQLSIT